MNKVFNIFIIAAIFSLLSCNREDTVQTDPDKPSEIRFDQVATKAGLSDLEKDGFGVWTLFVNEAQLSGFWLLDNTRISKQAIPACGTLLLVPYGLLQGYSLKGKTMLWELISISE